MKASFLLALFVLSSCASNRAKELSPFSRDAVCSDTSLAYLKKNELIATKNKIKPKYSTEEIGKRIEFFGPLVGKCYQDELKNPSAKPETFHLCLVTGYDSKGRNSFFEFSTKEIQLSETMKSCLASLKDRPELRGLKNVDIVQPFNLYPR